jgi:hypothetical protein
MVTANKSHAAKYGLSRTTIRKKRWYKVYRDRMNRGLEVCRNAGCNRLARTFEHIICLASIDEALLSRGATAWYNQPGNLTLFCTRCNCSRRHVPYPPGKEPKSIEYEEQVAAVVGWPIWSVEWDVDDPGRPCHLPRDWTAPSGMVRYANAADGSDS